MDKIQKFIEDYPEHGYRSLAQFVEDAVRRRADELKVFELTPRFEHFNMLPDHVTIEDKKLKIWVDIYLEANELRCEHCETTSSRVH